MYKKKKKKKKNIKKIFFDKGKKTKKQKKKNYYRKKQDLFISGQLTTYIRSVLFSTSIPISLPFNDSSGYVCTTLVRFFSYCY